MKRQFMFKLPDIGISDTDKQRHLLIFMRSSLLRI